MVSANPVGVGKINSDGGCGIACTTQLSYRDYFSRNTFYLFFFETWVNWRMIFKPLCIIANNFSTLCCFHIFEINNSFPSGFHSHWVVINLNKSIYIIYMRINILNPKHVVNVPSFQITIFIILYKLLNMSFLHIIFGNSCCFF